MNLNPSEAQIAAGNYKKRHEKFQGLNLSIENPKGSERRGIGKDGNPWSVKMPHDYGYIKRTEGADGDQVDVYVGHHKKSPHVFIVDQHDADSGEFDEHKVMLGFASAKQAAGAYDRGFSDGKGPDRRRAVLHLGMDDFKEWLAAGRAKKSVKGFARGGRINKADGGWVMLKQPQSASEPEAPPAPKPPAEEREKGFFEDIGSEAKKGFTDAVGDIAGAVTYNPRKKLQDLENDPNASFTEKYITGPAGAAVEGLGKTASGLMGIPGMVLNPLVKGAASIYGSGASTLADQTLGRLVPEEQREKARRGFREDQKAGFETAINAIEAPRISALRAAPPPARPSVAPMPETIGEFNVPLTVGEATRNAEQIAKEQKMLRGLESRPREEAEARIGWNPTSERTRALQEARDRIAASFDPQGQIIADAPEIGGNLIQQAVQDSRRNAKAQVNQAYKDLRQVEGEFQPDIFRDPLGERVSAYAFPDDSFRFNDRLMPNASDTLDYLNGLSARVNGGRPLTMADVVDARKSIVEMEKVAKKAAEGPQGSGADWEAMKRIKRGFDSFIDDALSAPKEYGFFSGDAQQARALHKAALQEHSAYRDAFFKRNSGDAVGAEMEKMFGKTPDQALESGTIISNILGAPTSLGQKDMAPKMVRRLRDVLGEGSAEFSALRQSAFKLLTEGEGRTPNNVARDIRRFLDGPKSRGTSSELFTPDQRLVIRRYGELMERMVPPAGTINFSSHQAYWNVAKKVALGLVGVVLGGASGGLPAAVVGGLGVGAYQAAKPFMDARKVAKWMPTFAESFDKWQAAQARLGRLQNPMNEKIFAAASTNLVNNLNKAGINGANFLKEINASRPVGAEEEDQKERPRD